MLNAPRVIYEHKDFLAVDKPAGLIVYKVRVKDTEPTLVDWLIRRFPEIASVGDDPKTRPGIVHRLDRDTSGILLVPRTQESFDYFKNLFKSRSILKTYLAVVVGAVKEKRGVITAPIGGAHGTVKRTVHSSLRVKEAVTEYTLLRTFEALGTGESKGFFSLLLVYPKTGRTHQIRVHLASMHHPVIGDRLYGFRAQPPWATRLMLHALSLEFTLMSGERMKVEAEAPAEFLRGASGATIPQGT